MSMRHQYLDQYSLYAGSKLLILGTIHPHNVDDFQVPFFYGNRNSIWNILSDAFPHALAGSVTFEGILSFLQQRKIAVSDTIKQCSRKNATALDSDLIPELLNHELLDQIRQSKIERILCTSAFGKNNAFRLFFKDLLGQKITPAIRASREVMLEPEVFGRPVLVKALYSPSG